MRNSCHLLSDLVSGLDSDQTTLPCSESIHCTFLCCYLAILCKTSLETMAPNADWDKIVAADPAEIQELEDDKVVSEWCNRVAEVCVIN